MSASTVRPYPELSVVGVALGTVQGVVMTASFVYIALKLGFGLGGSTVAAILGFVALRGVLRRKSIVENNINQTVASGINTASSGVVFTLPALMLLSVSDPTLSDFPVGPLIFSAIAGSLMGIVLIIPLRKQMVEFERLKFPSGVAVATLLKSPGEGVSQGVILVSGAAIAAGLTLLVNFGLVSEELDVGHVASLPPWLPFALYISAANFGAGLLSGRGGLPFALGGVLAWWVISPIAVQMGWVPPHAAMPPAEVPGWQAGEIYSQMLRPLGIGMLIGGALAGVVSAFPAVAGAMKSLQAAAKLAREQGSSPDELSPTVLGAEKEEITGHIGMVLASHVVSPHFDQVLQDFARQHPRVTYSIVIAESADVVNRIRQNRASFGICLLNGTPRNLEARVLFREYFALYCGPQHRLFAAENITLPDLRGEPSVSFQTETEGGPLMSVARLRERARLAPGLRGVSSNLPEVRRMIVANIGIGALPVHVGERDVKLGNLRQLPPYSRLPAVDIYLLTNPRRKKSPAETVLLGMYEDLIARVGIGERTYCGGAPG